MDALRNPDPFRSRETSPEPHGTGPTGAEARRGASPPPGMPEERLPPVSPGRARPSDPQAGPSSHPPRASSLHLLLGRPVLPQDLHDRLYDLLLREAGPSSPAADPPDLAGSDTQDFYSDRPSAPGQGLRPNSSVLTASPSPNGLDNDEHEDIGGLLAELDVPDDPQPGDASRILALMTLEPELEQRFQDAASALLARLLHSGVDPYAPGRHVDLPISLPQLSLVQSVVDSLPLHREPQDTRRADLALDIEVQQSPLGDEIHAWSGLTGVPIDTPHAFDHDDNARPFARVLARLRDEYLQINRETSARTTAQVASMLHAIASDAALRSEVFSLAQDALGDCRDNLAEGFSKMVLAVDNHRMVRAAERGEIDAKQLGEWAGSLFRLSLLETAVNRHIASRLRDDANLSKADRSNLTNEPQETMLHAKVDLRESLGLPSSTVSAMDHVMYSALAEDDLKLLKQEVERHAQNPEEHRAFLLGHPTWCAGMKALHPAEFGELSTRRDDDPFHDLDLPPDTDVAAQARYAEKALRVQQRYADGERALLMRLATDGAGPPETAAESSHSL